MAQHQGHVTPPQARSPHRGFACDTGTVACNAALRSAENC